MRLGLRLVSAGAISTAVLWGCTNGQVGGEIGLDGDGETAGGACEEKSRTVLTDDEVSSLGFSAGQLMDATRGTHESALSWGASSAQLALTPAAGDSTITLEVTPVRGSAVLVEFAEGGDDSGQELAMEGSYCSPEVQFDAAVVVHTGNGALADSFEATFRASSASVARATLALTPGEQQGSFDVVASGPDETTFVQSRLELAIARGVASGTFSGTLQTNDGEVASASSASVGHFPLETCSQGYVLDADSQWASDLLELLGDEKLFQLTWPSGTSTELTLSFQPSGPFCLLDSFSMPEMVVLQLETQAQSKDGRVDGTWALEAQIELDSAGEPTLVRVLRQAYLADTWTPATFAAGTGITGADFAGAELAAFSFDFQFSVGLAANGSLDVLGGTGPVCEEVEGDGGSCSGVDFQSIERASLLELD